MTIPFPVNCDLARNLLSNGASFTDATHQLGITEKIMRRWERDNRVKFARIRPTRRIAPEKESEVRRLLTETEETVNCIASMVGVSRDTVFRVRARIHFEVPSWVTAEFRSLYLDVAATRDECAAASVVRAAKRQVRP